MTDQLKPEDWNRLLNDGLDYSDSNSNTKGDFGKLSKKFGLAFIAYLQAAYQAKDEMSVDEFCRINGGIPLGFFVKKVKI